MADPTPDWLSDVAAVHTMQAAGGAIPAGKGPMSGMAVGGALSNGTYPGTSGKPPTQERGGIIGGLNLPWQAFIDEREQVPDLIWPSSIHIYERMAKDAQVAGLIAGCVLPITRYRWQLDPNGANPEMVDRIAEDLNIGVKGGPDDAVQGRSRDRFSFRKHLGLVLDYMLTYGHLFCEQVGTIDDSGLWRLRKLAPRPPRSITQIDVARDGGLVGIRQQGLGLSATTIPVGNLVAYVWQQEPGNWTGRSALRPMYKHWLIKDRLLRVDAVKHERTGMGVPVGTTPQGTNSEAQQALARALAALKVGDTSEVTIPYGSKIELLGTSGSIPDTIASVRYHDELMARSLLMMFMQLGTTASGSRALGDSQTDWFSMAQEAMAWRVADTFNEHVIEDWVDWNYGPDEPAPLLVFERVDDDSLPSADLAELVRYGAITVDDSTEEWLRDRHKMPKLDQPRPVPVAAPKLMDPSAEQPAAVADATATDALKAGRRPHPMLRKASFVSAQNPHGEARFAGDTGEYADRLPDRKLHRAPTHHEIASMADFKKLDEMWNAATDKLIADYKAKVLPGQLASIKKQQLKAKTIGELASVTVEATGAELMAKHLIDTAKAGIETAHEEAVAQGVTDAEKIGVSAVEDLLASRAQGAAILMANALSEIAGRKAVTIADPANIDNKAIATAVIDHIDGLSDRFLKDNLGGAITGAQNDGRAAQMENTEGGQIFSSELLDSDCCEECAAVDSTEYEDMAEARADYPAGGYIDCLGGPRCRGGLITVYDAQAQEDL